MNVFLKLAYLFFIGSTLGWVAEVIFRRFFSSANPERKWINPGFCVGPYVPLYGWGLCILYLLAAADGAAVFSGTGGKILLIVCMGLCMTAIEYIAGVTSWKVTHVRLWDYSREWGNIQGLICPKFSLVWTAAGAAYYFGVHPYILDALRWLSENLAFSFVIGFFFGVFCIDAVYSAKLLVKLRAFAEEHQIDIKLEALREQIRRSRAAHNEKPRFLFSFRTARPLADHLRESREAWIERRKEKK